MQAEECRVAFIQSVEFLDGTGMEPIMGPSGTNELPTCPVCLGSYEGLACMVVDIHMTTYMCPQKCADRLDSTVTGILTTLCNHAFHCRCLSKWRDASCPVCRHCQVSGSYLSSHSRSG